MSCMAISSCCAGGAGAMKRCYQTMQSLAVVLQTRLASFLVQMRALTKRGQRLLVSHLDSFWFMLLYFLSTSIAGFLALRILGQKKAGPTDLDLFFTSVSAATVSSMSTVDVEVLSHSQLVVVALLMMVGGEVFTSLVQLHMQRTSCCKVVEGKEGVKKMEVHEVELVEVVVLPASTADPAAKLAGIPVEIHFENKGEDQKDELKLRSINLLTLVILVYMALAHVFGFIATVSYLAFAGARGVLRKKGIPLTLYCTFVVASSFSSGGFVPTKEGMAPFKKNSGLLILLMPLLLGGNTMFPPVLRSILWMLKRFSSKKVPELEYLTSSKRQDLRFHHLLYRGNVIFFLVYTVWGLVLVQFLLFCSLEWNSSVLEGMNAIQKIVAVLFQSVNSRHAGESLFDLSAVSTAIVVLYLAMMYLPSYTVFLPGIDGTTTKTAGKQGNEEQPVKLGLLKSLVMSHLAYLVLFVILVCVTERRKLSEDPLNFNILSITVEVVSAYGNVGFSMGYSCNRQLQPDSMCEAAWCGFVGKWSTKGKLVLIFIMFFGRLKKFNMKGGRAWKLY